jgi:putative ABC transport system permease protein
MAFAPYTQFPDQGPGVALMLHSNMPPAAVAATIKRTVAGKHPEMIVESMDFQQRVRDGMVRERLMATLSGFFSLLAAAVLAMIGLYGVISYIVARRRNEIGIRVALGAARAQIVGMVMREAGLVLAIGIIVGTGLSLAAGRGAGSLLFGLKPYDPVTLAAASALLAAIALIASFLPARRASRLDPLVALRYE